MNRKHQSLKEKERYFIGIAMNLAIAVLYTARHGQPRAEIKKPTETQFRTDKLNHPLYLQDDPLESKFSNIFHILKHTKYNTWLTTSLNYTVILYLQNCQYSYTRIFKIKRGI